MRRGQASLTLRIPSALAPLRGSAVSSCLNRLKTSSEASSGIPSAHQVRTSPPTQGVDCN